MGQPRPKARPKRSVEGPCAEDGPPAPFRSWQAPPDGLFDVIVPKLTAKQFVVVQLVCKDWSRSARYCLKDATPKRPDVDLSNLVTLYPNLTQLNLSHVEGLSTRMLTPLRQLTALRELCLSNIALHHQHVNTDVGGDAAGQEPAAAAAAAAIAAGAATACRGRATHHHAPQPAGRPRTRSRARAVPTGNYGSAARTVSPPGALPPLPARSPSASNPTRTGLGGSRAVAGSPASCSPLLQRQKHHRPADKEPSSACTVTGAAAVEVGDGAGSGETVAAVATSSPPSSPPLSPASRIFGGLGDVLLRLSKLQADLCPALTADAIASLPNLTDLTLDTLVAPEALAPLGRLRCLAVKKLANAEALDRLSGLTALLVNSDSSCASEFLPVCTRLPELQSLTFKTSSTKVLQQPDLLCWQGFSRLTSLDLRAPVECLKPGLPALAELRDLRHLSLDLYCASDEELMVTVVAPTNLDTLVVSSDRSRSGGVIDVHPNPRLRSLRLRLYWTALNLVLPEGLPEPSPMSEPMSEDMEPEPDLGRGLAVAERLALAAHGRDVDSDLDLDLDLVPAGAVDADEATEDRPGPCDGLVVAAGEGAGAAAGRRCGRGVRRRRDSGASPSPRTTPGAEAAAAAAGGGVDFPERGLRRRAVGAGRKEAERGSSGDESGGAGGSEGSGEEEVGFAPGDGTSGGGGVAPGAAARAKKATADAKEAEQEEEEVEAESGRERKPVVAAGEPSGWRQPLHARPASRYSGGEAVSGGAAAAAFETPLSDRRGSGSGTGVWRGSAGGGGGCGSAAAAAVAGVGTPAASAGGGCCFSVMGGGGGPEMELQEICLDACFFLLYGSLVPVLRQFPQLGSLTLDNCLALENGELTQLCELSGLRQVSLSGVHLVTDSGLRALGRLPRLASLRVKGLRKLSVHAAQAYMRQKAIVRRYEDISGAFLSSLSGLTDLRFLALKHLHTAGEAALAAGLGAMTQLARLEIKDVHSMSDAVLLALSRHTGLQELSVLHCEAVTSRGRNAVVRALGQRVALDFDGCSLPDITRPCALPTTSTQAQLIDDDQVSISNQPRRSCQHSNQH